jgi:glycosyltransferase involved in cell wall biosynthesis
MRILHIHDVASVAALMAGASHGRDIVYQPVVRHDFLRGSRSLPAFAWGRIRDILRLRRLTRSGDFTHVHVHYALFAHLADLAGAPYSLHLHGGDLLLDLRGGLKRRLTRRGIARATRVAVATPDLLELARAYRPDAVYIANPIALPPLPAPPPPRAQPHVIVVSKMDRLKGWDRQPEVLESLRAVLPGLSFTFFAHGQLPQETRVRLSERLVGLGGRVMSPLTRAEFHARLAEADFALGQLEVGSLGMSELEAIASGVPTIANVRAHVAVGYEPVVISDIGAPAQVRALWEAGSAARRRWGEEGRAYLRRVHAPERALEALERLIVPSGG